MSHGNALCMTIDDATFHFAALLNCFDGIFRLSMLPSSLHSSTLSDKAKNIGGPAVITSTGRVRSLVHLERTV